MAAAEILHEMPISVDEHIAARKAERERAERERAAQQAEKAQDVLSDFEAAIVKHIPAPLLAALGVECDIAPAPYRTPDFGDCTARFAFEDEEWRIRYDRRDYNTDWLLQGPSTGYGHLLSAYRDADWSADILDALDGRREERERQRLSEEERAKVAAGQAERTKAEEAKGPTTYRLISRAMTHAHEHGAEIVLQLVDGTRTLHEATVNGYDEHAALITHAGAQRLVPWCRIAEIVLHPGPRVDEEVPF